MPPLSPRSVLKTESPVNVERYPARWSRSAESLERSRCIWDWTAARALPRIWWRNASDAYGVVTAWLRYPPVAARLPRLDQAHLTELARLLPELAARVPPPEPLPEAELRRRLSEAIARALLAAGAPLLLIVDDAQWADAQSLRVLHYLVRTAPSARLLVAARAGTTRLLPAKVRLVNFKFRSARLLQ